MEICNCNDICKEIMNLVNRDEEKTVLSGFHAMDVCMNGFHPGEITLIGGENCMGKTSFAIDMALQIAEQGKTVLYICNNESRLQLVWRMIINLKGNFNHDELNLQRLDSVNMDNMQKAISLLETKKIFIEDNIGSANDINELVRNSALDGQIDMLIIDSMDNLCLNDETEKKWFDINERRKYLESLEPAEANVDRITTLFGELEVCAKNWDFPSVCLIESPKVCEYRINHRPIRRDLRLLGPIEKYVDNILFIYRESFYDVDASECKAELIIAKNAKGNNCTIGLNWNRHRLSLR